MRYNEIYGIVICSLWNKRTVIKKTLKHVISRMLVFIEQHDKYLFLRNKLYVYNMF